jgi:putative FmdB family regulatory protein
MPLYEYRCPTCRKTFELLRPMSESTTGATCPRGHKHATRTLSLIAAPVRESSPGASQAGCACGNGACGCAH